MNDRLIQQLFQLTRTAANCFSLRKLRFLFIFLLLAAFQPCFAQLKMGIWRGDNISASMPAYDSAFRREVWMTAFPFEFYIETWKNGKSGACDSAGRLILEPVWNQVDLERADAYCHTSEWFFQVRDNEGRCGLTDRDGNMLIAPQKNCHRISCCYLSRECTDGHTPYAVMHFQKKQQDWSVAINLRTRAVSPKHADIFPYLEGFVYLDKNKWGLLDSAFTPVMEDLAGEPFYFGGVYHDDQCIPREMRYSVQMQYGGRKGKKSLDPDVLLYQTLEYAKSPYQKELLTREVFGLLNIRNGRSIEPFYDDIRFKRQDSATFYWCIRYAAEDGSIQQDRGSITVLDTLFHPIRMFHFSEEENLFYEDECRFFNASAIDFDGKLFVFRDTLLRFGAVNGRGETVIPFMYDEGYTWSCRSDVECETYQFMLDSLTGLYDGYGKNFVPVRYTSIVPGTEGYLLGGKGLFYALLDSNGRELADSCTRISFGVPLEYTGTTPRTEMGTVLSKNGFLWRYRESGLQRMDSTQLRFRDRFLPVAGKYLIERSGKIVAENDQLARSGNIYVSLRWKDSYTQQLTVVDAEGRPIHELSVRSSGVGKGLLYVSPVDRSADGTIDISTGEWVRKPALKAGEW